MEKMEFEKHQELTDFIQEMASSGQAPREWSKFLDVLNKALSQPDVIKSVCDHEYITDANWKSLTCRKCNDRIEPKQTVL